MYGALCATVSRYISLVTTFIALLRAVNVGGTGKLAMAELRSMCSKLGFTDVATYIQSGNVVFTTKISASKAQATLEAALTKHLGKPSAVILRTRDELIATERANPFPAVAPSQLLVLFLDEAPPKSSLVHVKIPGREQLACVGREVFIHFPDGMGRSKLKLPFANAGTGRNLNTLRKLIEMAGPKISKE